MRNEYRVRLTVTNILTLQSPEALTCSTPCLDSCHQCPKDEDGAREPQPLLLSEAPFCGKNAELGWLGQCLLRRSSIS